MTVPGQWVVSVHDTSRSHADSADPLVTIAMPDQATARGYAIALQFHPTFKALQARDGGVIVIASEVTDLAVPPGPVDPQVIDAVFTEPHVQSLLAEYAPKDYQP